MGTGGGESIQCYAQRDDRILPEEATQRQFISDIKARKPPAYGINITYIVRYVCVLRITRTDGLQSLAS